MRLEGPVELDCVDAIDAVGEVTGQDAEPRADLEGDVAAVELSQPADHAEDVLVGQEVLAELAVRDDGERRHGRPNAAAAFVSICASSSSGSSPRTCASATV